MTSMIDVARVDIGGSADGLRLTPYEAMVRDLLFIRTELENGGNSVPAHPRCRRASGTRR